MTDFQPSLCTCPFEGFDPSCPWARGGLGHVKRCPSSGVACPCLPGSTSEGYCAAQVELAEERR